MNYYRFSILLAASVPSEKRSPRFQEVYTKIKNAQIQIEEAIIGLARNIFQANGRIVFGGHPSISPLVAMVATEFSLNKEIENTGRSEESEKPITIYQSRAFEKAIPVETSNLFTLGYSNIIWTEAVNGEEYNPDEHGKVQCEQSLELMRRRMTDEPLDALVCMGGMEGVEQEFQIFREYHRDKPVFLLRSTGGATKFLADRYSDYENVRVMDDSNYTKYFSKENNEGGEEKFDIIPYSYITALIVKEVLSRKLG